MKTSSINTLLTTACGLIAGGAVATCIGAVKIMQSDSCKELNQVWNSCYDQKCSPISDLFNTTSLIKAFLAPRCTDCAEESDAFLNCVGNYRYVAMASAAVALTTLGILAYTRGHFVHENKKSWYQKIW